MRSIYLGILFLFPFTQGEAITAAIVSGAISAGASLIGTSVTSLSGQGPNRNIVIEITNHLETPLHGGQYFLQWGWNSVPPASVIRKETREAIQFQKVPDTATGTAGVLAYNIGTKQDPARIAIVFSIPYNYIHASNWFGIQYISSSQLINKDLYLGMYNDADWYNRKIDKQYAYAYEGKPIAVFLKDYIVSATMSNFGRSILKIDIMKREGSHKENEHLFRGRK